MVENNSIDNLDRQDLLMVLDGFIEQTRQINETEHKYHSRYDDIAHEVVLTEYKKPKNLIIAYFLAPFSSGTFFSWLFALLGDIALIHLLFIPINIIIDLSRGLGLGLSFLNRINGLGEWLLFVLLGTIGYFMARKNYMEDWVEKAIKKGTYNNEIDAAVDSDPQIIDYKNKHTSLVSDETYQQYRSLIPQNFAVGDIIWIYKILQFYKADNFREAVNVWLQENHDIDVKLQHDREVKKQHDREERQAERQAELAAEQQAKFAELLAEKQASLAKQEAKEAAKEAKAKRIPIIDSILDYYDELDEREKKEAAKRADKANKAIIKKFKDD